jgi:hypothetical protein
VKDYDLHSTPTPAPPQAYLPQVDLESIDLGQELADNLTAARQLRLDISYDDTPANQKAQVMNTITTILTNLVKLQMDLYNAQRLKDLESVLIDVMKTQPESLQTAFFDAYEARLQ